MVAAPAQLPDLSDLDKAILSRLFTLDSLKDLAESLTSAPIPGAPTSLFDLYQWASRPDIRPWIEHHQASETDRLKRRHLAHLDAVADTTENLVERRRASTAILRILCAPARQAPRNPRPAQPAPLLEEPDPPAPSAQPPAQPHTRPPRDASRLPAASKPSAAPKSPTHAATPASVHPDAPFISPAQPRPESPINRLTRLAGHNPRLSPNTG